MILIKIIILNGISDNKSSNEVNNNIFSVCNVIW